MIPKFLMFSGGVVKWCVVVVVVCVVAVLVDTLYLLVDLWWCYIAFLFVLLCVCVYCLGGSSAVSFVCVVAARVWLLFSGGFVVFVFCCLCLWFAGVLFFLFCVWLQCLVYSVMCCCFCLVVLCVVAWCVCCLFRVVLW